MRRAAQLQKFRTDGHTMSPERLVVLLYERLGRDLSEASEAIRDGDAERRHTALMHAQEIVEELSYGLRPDLWDGSDDLLAIYNYVLEQLVAANVGSDRRALGVARRIVDDLTDAWRQAYEDIAATQATAIGTAS